MLEKRLEYLYDTVDLFLIVEADHTFVGNQKNLNFLNNIKKYQKYLDKILYCPIFIDMSKYKVWEYHIDEWSFRIEIDQRNHIGKILNRFPSDSVVILGDIDEIPVRHKISQTIEHLQINKFDSIVLKYDMFYYNFNQKQTIPWWGSIVCYNNYIQKYDAQWARSSRVYNASIENAGYHLSYWGDAEKIRYKIENFAHTEFAKEEYTAIDKIQQRIDKGEDIFSRSADFNQLIKVNKEDIDKEIYSIFSKVS